MKQNKPKKQKKESVSTVRKYVFAAVLLIISIVAYSKITDFKLVFFDDADLISKYSKIVNDGYPVTYCFNDVFGEQYYRPVLSLSFYLNALISGDSPVGYYWMNILLHAASVVLIFFLFQKLKLPEIYSFLGALLLAVHPILTPAVAWISGRNDPLLMIFTAASFIFLIKWSDSEDKSSKSLINLSAHFIFLLIALFTKESAIVLPVLFALWVFLFKRDKLNASWIITLLFIWVLAANVFLFSRSMAHADLAGNETFGLAAVLQNLPSVFAIIGKMIIPLKMNGSAQFEWFSIGSGILVLVLIFGLIFYFRENINLKVVSFNLLWIIAFLFPSLLIRLEYPHFDYLEHRAYIISFSFFIIIYELLKATGADFKKPAFYYSFAVIFILFGIKSQLYSNTFSDRFTFQNAVVEMYPESYTGYYNLGKAYDQEENTAEALRYYKTAISKNPKIGNIYIYLSGVYLKQNDTENALIALNKAAEIKPEDPYVKWNYSRIFLAKGDTAKGLQYAEIALTKAPRNAGWMGETAMNFISAHNYYKAEYYFNRALKLNPKEISNYINLGVSYFYNNKFTQAEEIWLKATNMFPTAYQPHYNLIEFYLKTNNKEKARVHARAAENFGAALSKEIIEQIK